MNNSEGISRAEHEPAGPPAIARVQAALGSLVASERRVAEVVLANPRAIIAWTASELASKARTSATTVIRFAKNSGFSGYQDLAVALALSEATPQHTEELERSDSAATTLRKVGGRAANAVGGMAEAVDPEAFTRAVQLISAANHTLCLGAALSAPAALDFAYRLNHLGLAADAPADSQVQHIRAFQLRSRDVCIVFLHGGKYPPVVEAARAAKHAGAIVIGVTAFSGTPLADLADIPLILGARTVHSGLAAWESRLASLALVDALVAAIAHFNPAQSDRSVSHIQDLIEQDLL